MEFIVSYLLQDIRTKKNIGRRITGGEISPSGIKKIKINRTNIKSTGIIFFF
jgi:hypothetical protein